MKHLKILLFALLVTCVTQIKAQTNKSYNIIWGELTTTSEIDKGPLYQKILDSADLESFRLKTKRDTLTFSNGMKVELLSAQELFINGYNIDPSNYSDTRDPKYTKPTFMITNEGYLIALYNRIEK